MLLFQQNTYHTKLVAYKNCEVKSVCIPHPAKLSKLQVLTFKTLRWKVPANAFLLPHYLAILAFVSFHATTHLPLRFEIESPCRFIAYLAILEFSGLGDTINARKFHCSSDGRSGLATWFYDFSVSFVGVPCFSFTHGECITRVPFLTRQNDFQLSRKVRLKKVSTVFERDWKGMDERKQVIWIKVNCWLAFAPCARTSCHFFPCCSVNDFTVESSNRILNKRSFEHQ